MLSTVYTQQYAAGISDGADNTNLVSSICSLYSAHPTAAVRSAHTGKGNRALLALNDVK
jgi:hypothetical protein